MNQNFYNGFQNMNNSTFNNQPNFNQDTPTGNEHKSPKKNNLLIIVIVVIAVVSIVVGCALMFGGNSKSESNDKNNGNDKQNIKQITYFNNENKSNDSIGFNLEQSINTQKGVFVGIKGKGVSSNLSFDISMLENDVLMLTQYSKGDELSITYDDEFYIFELDGDSYLKDGESEYLDNDAIVYKDDNYFVTETSINNYLLYYLYEEVHYDGFRDDKVHGYWYALNISFCDTLDDAKDKIDKIREVVDICVYDLEDGLDNCITENDEKLNYKEYKYIKDVVVDSLIDYDLYVDSYENITQTEYDEITVEKYINLEGAEEDDFTKFKISFESGNLESKEGDIKYTLNGKEIIIRESTGLSYAYIKNENNYIKIMIDLPYNVEGNIDIIKEVLTETFSKTK